MLEYLPSFERSILAQLRLNISDAARICGITPRQLSYWTEKGYLSTADDSEHCYDIDTMEKAILITRAINRGYVLEAANKVVTELLEEEERELQRLVGLDETELRAEVIDYLGELEERLASLREELPTYLTISRLGHTALRLDGKVLERFFRENPYSFDTAPNIAFRLGYAPDEVEPLLEDLVGARLLDKSAGEAPIYRLRREGDSAT